MKENSRDLAARLYDISPGDATRYKFVVALIEEKGGTVSAICAGVDETRFSGVELPGLWWKDTMRTVLDQWQEKDRPSKYGYGPWSEFAVKNQHITWLAMEAEANPYTALAAVSCVTDMLRDKAAYRGVKEDSI